MPSDNEDSLLQGRDENTQKRNNQLVVIMKETVAEWDREHLKSRLASLGKPRRTESHLVFRADVHDIGKN